MINKNDFLDITAVKEDRPVITEAIDGVEHRYEIHVLDAAREDEHRECLKRHGFSDMDQDGKPIINPVDAIGMARDFISIMVDIPEKRLDELGADTINAMVDYVNVKTGLAISEPPKKKGYRKLKRS